MKKLSTLVSMLVLILCSVDPVHALSCEEPGPPQQKVQDSGAVFSGEVIAIEEVPISQADYDAFVWQDAQATFKVREVWKGVDTSTVMVKYETAWTEFEQGQHYLVYADYSRDSESGRKILIVNACLGTPRLADAQDELRALGAGSIPLQPATEASGEEVAIGQGPRNVSLLLAVGGFLVISMSVGFVLQQRRARR